MRVKCVDNWFYEHLIKVGVIYEVLEFSYGYAIKPGVVIDKNKFVVIEEEKMDQVKIVRKLEDLDGLENGNGLKISVYGHPLMIKAHIPFEDNIVFSKMVKDCRIETIHQLKAMGFKFEHKPLRTKEEVVEDMKLNSEKFIFNGFNYYIRYVEQFNKYYMDYHCSDTIVGALYFNRETAEKYVTELNEILESEKNGF